jgi:pimeloyl-ACP methyl ester carboxylesterase
MMTTRRIDSLESFDIGGFRQWVLLRGDLRSRRVVLIIQQGPGLPIIHDARTLQRNLMIESDAVVAYWDQRGTGKSFGADPSTLDLAHSVSDALAVVDSLCARFQVDQVEVVGFSLGGTIATLAAAQNPARIAHLVAVGIDVDMDEGERYAYDFVCEESARRNDRGAKQQLQAIGPPPHDTAKKFSTRAKWVMNYGGVHQGLGYYGLLWSNVRGLLVSPHYSIREAVQALRAIESTQTRMLPSLMHFDLRKVVTRIDVPITFFQGRLDHVTPPKLVAAYVDALEAPRGKSLVWFEASAHMPYYEEPAKFREALTHALDLVPRAAAA